MLPKGLVHIKNGKVQDKKCPSCNMGVRGMTEDRFATHYTRCKARLEKEEKERERREQRGLREKEEEARREARRVKDLPRGRKWRETSGKKMRDADKDDD